MLPQVYEASRGETAAPEAAFARATASLPSRTEAEQLVLRRIGQDLFRDRLMALWAGRCPLTGITDPALLRASHIKPWTRCENDAERLDPQNGLLLSALWDAAFDAGLVTFDQGGQATASSRLDAVARIALGIDRAAIPVSPGRLVFLAWHRSFVFQR